MEESLFKLKVQSKEGILYQGDVSSITSYNEKGIFDVLALHANFISLIKKGVEIMQKNGESKNIPFELALLRVRQNQVEVYLGV